MKIIQNTFGIGSEGSKTRMRRTYKTPNNAEDQQGQYAVSKVGMPLHSITTEIDADDATDNAEHQKPVKEANR